MTQIRKFEFRDDDKTVDINAQLMGIIESGVYRGFDAQLDAGLVLKLIHTATGGTFVDETPAVVENIGILRTKQGTVIHEDSLVEITIGTNDTGDSIPQPRIDLIVCEHWHQNIAGGVQAIYYAIPGGQSATPVAPVLTDPAKQMIIGELYLPGGCASLDEDGVVFTKAPLPTNPSLPDIAYPATYDPDTKTISTLYKNHSLYYILSSGISSDYPEVDTIDLFTINYLTATLISSQKYSIISGGNLYFNSETSNMIVEGYEEIQVFATAEFFGGAVGACMVVTTGRVFKNSVNKLYCSLIGNIGTNGTLTTKALTFSANGNIQKITVTGNAEINSINTFAQPNTLPGYNSGMQLIVQITTTDRITLKHLAAGISAPYKNIYIYGKKDIMLSGNISLFFYEDENNFVLFQWNADTVLTTGGGAGNLRNGVFCGTGTTELADALKSFGISELHAWDLLFIDEIDAGVSESGQFRYTIKIMNADTVNDLSADATPWLQWTSLVSAKKTGYQAIYLQEDDGSGVAGGVLVIDWDKLTLAQYVLGSYKAGALFGISLLSDWFGSSSDIVELPLTTITENKTIDGASKLYIVDSAANIAIILDSIKICRSTISIKNNMIADYVCRVECLDGENINNVLAITIPAFTTVTLYKNVNKWEATGSYVEEPLP